jgi:hypothetical protein
MCRHDRSTPSSVSASLATGFIDMSRRRAQGFGYYQVPGSRKVWRWEYGHWQGIVFIGDLGWPLDAQPRPGSEIYRIALEWVEENFPQHFRRKPQRPFPWPAFDNPSAEDDDFDDFDFN